MFLYRGEKMIYGYARISDSSQKEDSQIDALKEYGCDEIISEVIQGDKEDKKLYELIDSLQEGDTLVVTRVDRLGRDSIQMMTYAKKIQELKANLVIIELGIDTNTLAGQLVLGMFSQIAEWDRKRLKEKQRAGIEAARARGKHLGRPVKYTKKSFEKAVLDYLDGETVADVSDTYNIPRSTFYKFLKDEGIQR